MTTVVDARGLPCPQPVILTRKALQESDEVTTIVDNEISRQNVTRMVEKAGAVVQADERDDGIYLHITGARNRVLQKKPGFSTVLLISSEFMGRGDDELGQVLMRGFFHSLGEVEPLPDTIIFFNSGVKLVTEGSPVLDDLQDLRGRGTEILSCGTCLGHYDLKDKIAVGEISNMYTIAETILGAGKVVNL